MTLPSISHEGRVTCFLCQEPLQGTRHSTRPVPLPGTEDPSERATSSSLNVVLGVVEI